MSKFFRNAFPLALLLTLLGLPLLPQSEGVDGFDTYWMVFLERGDARGQSPQAIAQIQAAHQRHLGELIESGKALAAGPFDVDETEPMRGIVLFPGSLSLEEVRAMAHDDDAVRAGRIKVRIMKWFTPAGQIPFPKP